MTPLHATLDTLAQAAALLHDADRVLIATGAGMSADSGVPTYRDPDGRWRDFTAFTSRGLRPADIAHLDGYQRDPHQAWGFHAYMRALIAQARPHPGYDVITRWVTQRIPDAFVLTTNIDGYHIDTGVPRHKLWQRYGSLWELQCLARCRDEVWPAPEPDLVTANPETLRAERLPDCPFCGGVARPRVQLDHDPDFMQAPYGAERYTRFMSAPVDVCLVVGTSLWLSWPEIDGAPRPRVIHINPNPETHARYDAPIPITLGAEVALTGLDWMLRCMDAAS